MAKQTEQGGDIDHVAETLKHLRAAIKPERLLKIDTDPVVFAQNHRYEITGEELRLLLSTPLPDEEMGELVRALYPGAMEGGRYGVILDLLNLYFKAGTPGYDRWIQYYDSLCDAPDKETSPLPPIVIRLFSPATDDPEFHATLENMRQLLEREGYDVEDEVALTGNGFAIVGSGYGNQSSGSRVNTCLVAVIPEKYLSEGQGSDELFEAQVGKAKYDACESHDRSFAPVVRYLPIVVGSSGEEIRWTFKYLPIRNDDHYFSLEVFSDFSPYNQKSLTDLLLRIRRTI